MFFYCLVLFVACFVIVESGTIPRGCFKSSAKDVCNGDIPDIPELSSRDPTRMITKETAHWKYCDVYAIRKHQWYKTSRRMTTNCPSMYMCGTKFPIWLTGTNPEPQEGIVNRLSCVKTFDHCCIIKYRVTIVNCDKFMAYCFINLPSGCHQRYCFEMPKLSVNVSSGLHINGYDDYDNWIAQDASMSTTSQPVTVKKKTRKQEKKHKNKSGLQFPLRVQFPHLTDPMCFNLYDIQLENSSGTYMLYADANTGLKVEAQIRKKIKQGGIKEIRLTSRDHHDIITSETFHLRKVSPAHGAPWVVTFLPADERLPFTKIWVKLGALDMNITSHDGIFLNAVAKMSMLHGTHTGNGILGQIMSKNIQLETIQEKFAYKSTGKGNVVSGKRKAKFNVDGMTFFAPEKKLGPPGNSTEKCWALKNKDNQMYSMTAARVE